MKTNSQNKRFLFLAYLIIGLLCSCSEDQTGSSNLLKIEDNWKMSRLGSKEKLKAYIPSTVQEIMLEHDKIPDPYFANEEYNIKWMENESWEYTTWFKPGNNWTGFDHLELICYGLDTYATVFLNDDTLFVSNNMFRQWKADITDLISSGRNELRIVFQPALSVGINEAQKLEYDLPANDYTAKESVFLRKAPFHFGSEIGPRIIATGIWKPIEIIGWNDFKVENIGIQILELSRSKAKLRVDFDISSNSDSKLYMRLTNEGISDNFRGYFLKKGLNKKQLEFEIENPEFWWPRGYGEQNITQFQFQFSNDPSFQTSKSIQIKTGLRNIQLVQELDEFGSSFYFRMNDKPIFIKGVTYLPAGIFIRDNSKEKIDRLISDAHNSNINLIRVWGGGTYLDNHFYDLCDSLGIMVWQDFMFSNGMIPGDQSIKENITLECEQQVKKLQNHPSIVLWCGNHQIENFWKSNETVFDQYYSYAQSSKIFRDYEVIFKEVIPEIVRLYDSDVPYISSTPLGDSNQGDIHDFTYWDGLGLNSFTNKAPRFVSSLGLASYPDKKTLSVHIDEPNLKLGSEILMNRGRVEDTYNKIIERSKARYPSPTSVSDLSYYSQLNHAKYLENSINFFRLNYDRCMGSIIWTLNDTWTGASFGLIDFEGRWKAAQYRLKDRYKPTLIIPQFSNNKLSIFAVSDALEIIDAILEFDLKDFDGNVLLSGTSLLTLVPGKPILAEEFYVNQVAPGYSKSSRYLKTRIIRNGEIIDEEIVNFVPEKFLSLTEPSFEFTLDRRDILGIDISCDVFAKNVVLDFEGMKGHFSHNFFDMEPDTTYKVQFTPDQGQKLQTFLSIRSMANKN